MWEVPAGDVSVADAQDALADNGLDGLTIQTLTSADEVLPPDRGRAHRRSREGPGGHAGAGGAHRVRHRGREPHRRRAVVGRGDQPQGAPRAGGVPRPHHDLHHAAVRAPHGDPHARRADPRRADHDRRVLDRRLRGHPRDRDRGAHHPRLLDLRRHRGVRQGRREHQAGRHHPRAHLQRHGRPLAQPGADALAEHVDHRAAARWRRC